MRELDFGGGRRAIAASLDAVAALPGALAALRLRPDRPAIVLVGGAGALPEASVTALEHLFAGTLAPLADALGACVLDGGTDEGVMALMGRARRASGAGFPLVGVAARGTVTLPGAPPADGRARLEPHHSHFLLVPGDRFGDESPWLAAAAACLGRSVSVLVEGGEIACRDVVRSVEAGRAVVVAAGTGRAADALAAALRGEGATERARALAASGLLLGAEGALEMDAAVRRTLAGAP